MLRPTLLALVALLASINATWAQFDDPAAKADPAEKGKAAPRAVTQETLLPGGPQLDQPLKQYWIVGMAARNGSPVPHANLFGTIAVPNDWPEQKVTIAKEDISPSVKKVTYRVTDGGVKQMLMTIPTLAPGESAKALVSFEVTRYSLSAPKDTSIFVLPTRTPLAVKKHLGASPFIEATQAKIRQAAQEMISGKESAWEQVEAIYDGVRSRVKWENNLKEKGALAALADGKSNREDITGLFVGLCRAIKVPARMVWVPDSMYAEFYLEDAEGNGYWIPCFVATDDKEFGFVKTQAPILQKGDNFKVPEKKEAVRFVAEFLTGKATNGARPIVEFVRRLESTP